MGVNLVTGFLETLQTSLGHFALAFGGVSGGALLALLLNLSSAVDNIILDFMDLLLGPALGLVLSATDLGSLDVAILDQRSSADLHSLVEGNLLVLDLLNHLDLVNTSLAVGSGRGSGDIIEAGGFLDSCLSLTIISGGEALNRIPGCVISMISMVMVVMVVMVTPIVGIEGEGVDKRLAVSGTQSPQLPGAKDALAANGHDEKQLCIHVVSFDEPAGALRTRTLL